MTSLGNQEIWSVESFFAFFTTVFLFLPFVLPLPLPLPLPLLLAMVLLKICRKLDSDHTEKNLRTPEESASLSSSGKLLRFNSFPVHTM